MKVVYIVSKISRWVSFEWICEYPRGFELIFIVLSTSHSHFTQYLDSNLIKNYKLFLDGIMSYPQLTREIFRILRKERPDIVHTHFLDASVTGLMAAKLAGISKRVYTRHHSTFHHDYAPKGVFLDKLCNWLATDIISISNVVNQVLASEGVDLKKIHLVEHGFRLSEFDEARNNHETRKRFRDKYQIGKERPAIGVVARHIEWKGVQYIIPAFKNILDQSPTAVLMLCNARGPYHDVILDLLKDLPESSYRIIPFEEEMIGLYQAFDIYVHTPINERIEAFGQTYIEALASGIPSIFTFSGIGRDMIVPGENALVVPFCDSEAITEAILSLLSDKVLRERLVSNGINTVRAKFAFEEHFRKLTELYQVV